MVIKYGKLFEIFHIVAQCEPGVNEANEMLGNEGKNEESRHKDVETFLDIETKLFISAEKQNYTTKKKNKPFNKKFYNRFS